MTGAHEVDLDQHPTAAHSSIVDTVPIIDIGGLMQGEYIDHGHAAVEQIAEAARQWGFFQVVNHGVSKADIEKIWNETRRLFEKPGSEKETLLRTRDNPWGYYNHELTKNQRDKKEVFDFTSEGSDSIYHSANRWPAAGDGFKQAMLDYLQICTRLPCCCRTPLAVCRFTMTASGMIFPWLITLLSSTPGI